MFRGPPSRPASFNDDLVLGHFRAGEQRDGSQFNIPNASSRADHVLQAAKEPFHLSDPIPIPGEIISSVDFLSSYPGEQIRGIWDEQFPRLAELISAASPAQEVWNSFNPLA